MTYRWSYISPDTKQITLFDLVEVNANTTLTRENSVFCGKCLTNTSQLQTRTFNPDCLLIEIIRATNSRGNYWSKNAAPITFPTTDLKLPGFNRSYRILSTCHHLGSSVNSGHWNTKVLTSKGWYKLDDLGGECSNTTPPGLDDNSVTVLLLIAEDKLQQSS